MVQVFRSNVVYRDQRAAIRWLERAFGLEVALMIEGPDGELGHCQMRYGEATISIGRLWDEAAATPQMLGGRFTQTVSLHLSEDVDAHFQRAKAAGAEIIGEPEDRFYGDRSYACRDPEGHIWHISQEVRQVSVEEMERASGLSVRTGPGASRA